MMRLKLSQALFALALGAAGTAGALAQDETPLYVRDEMQQRVDPAITAIWAVTNVALDDDGNLDPALIDDSGWIAIAQQAAALETVMHDMAEAPVLAAASPGNTTTEEWEVSMDRVQDLIDENPAAFRAYASTFAEHAARLRAAADARDGALTGELVAGADGACEGCHLTFWASSEG
ncbi:MAG: cytochrome c [Erythrobacter sp.]|nr:cytochrome c [Erythrobacter sp.]